MAAISMATEVQWKCHIKPQRPHRGEITHSHPNRIQYLLIEIRQNGRIFISLWHVTVQIPPMKREVSELLQSDKQLHITKHKKLQKTGKIL